MSINKIYTLLFVLCLISCSEEMDTIINEEGDNRIKFSVGISNDAGTRISTGNNFKTIFENNDAIGLFIYMRSEGKEPSIDEDTLYVDNIKLTYKNGNWEIEKPIYYPDSEKLLDIYAYYPYKKNTEVHALEYNADKEMDELLMSSVIGVKKRENAIVLKLKHLQSLVHITLTKNDNVPDFDEDLNVYFNGVIGGKYNIATQELAEPTTGIIKMDLMGDADEKVRSYVAFVPEQEAVPGILFSIFQMTSGKEILSSKDIDQPEIFTRGQIKPFYIQIKQEISKDIVYNLYDLYPAYGIPVGMVIEVYNGGKNGKVISLRNVDKVAWAIPEAEAYATGATDINDGISNKMKVQSLENWEDNYPAFKACITYGERWYLPCIGEMRWFLTNYSNGYRLNAINNNLVHYKNNNPELDIEVVYTDESYFSSTESYDDPTRALKLYTGGSFNTPADPKHWPYYIRPFYEF